MPKIFISYRRADAQPIVGRIYEHLSRVFGADNVFMDVQDIPAGEHFKTYLEKQVWSCDVLLVIIGQQWLTAADPEGNRRLDSPDDFVRIEVESGLIRKNARVIPVLIHETPMPDLEDLPESLRDLHYRNASRIRYDPDFTTDMLRLIGQLGGSPDRPVRSPTRWVWVTTSLMALVILVMMAVAVIGSGLLTRIFFPFVEVSQTAQAQMTQQAATATAAAAAGPDLTSTAATNISPALEEGPEVTVLSGASLRQTPDSEAPRAALVLVDTPATVRDFTEDGEWLYLILENGRKGWARRDILDIEEDFRWRVLFTSPDGREYRDSWSGIDLQFARAIDEARYTVDLAAFELNHPVIYEALVGAHQRGVQVRIVTDNDHGLDIALYQRYQAAPFDSARQGIADEMETPPEDTLLDDLYDTGIPIVDDGRSALMHHEFAILDGTEVWAGSWNYTLNDTYRNNNNVLTLRDPDVLARFQAEFDRMFEERIFDQAIGTPSQPVLEAEGQFSTVYFTPGNDEIVPLLLALVKSAEDSVRFMVFSFTLDELGEALVTLQNRDVQIEGIVETTGSQTEYSETSHLYCAGANVRIDGNPFILNHKVIIIDDEIVITGSMNLSDTAMQSNDENLIVVLDPALAEQYTAEFQRRWADSSQPTGITCE